MHTTTLYMHLACSYKLNEQDTQHLSLHCLPNKRQSIYLPCLAAIKFHNLNSNMPCKPNTAHALRFLHTGKTDNTYSGKISKAKSVANFKCESFLHKFWGRSIRWRHKQAIHKSLKIIFSANSPKFSPFSYRQLSAHSYRQLRSLPIHINMHSAPSITPHSTFHNPLLHTTNKQAYLCKSAKWHKMWWCKCLVVSFTSSLGCLWVPSLHVLIFI